MLVNRKQEWLDLPPPPIRVNKPAPQPQARPASQPAFRKKCLQLVGLAVALAMLITLHSEYRVRAGYDLVDLKAQVAKLEKENDLLRLDVAKLKSPQRIQQIATKDLGLVQPQSTMYATSANRPAGADTDGQASSQQVAGMMKVKKAEASKGR